MKKLKINFKKVKIYYNKLQFFGFLLLNILDQNFKISTIVETLVTLLISLSSGGHLPIGDQYHPGGSLQLHMSIHFAPQKCMLAF